MILLGDKYRRKLDGVMATVAFVLADGVTLKREDTGEWEKWTHSQLRILWEKVDTSLDTVEAPNV